jgi:hypothetical protein
MNINKRKNILKKMSFLDEENKYLAKNPALEAGEDLPAEKSSAQEDIPNTNLPDPITPASALEEIEIVEPTTTGTTSYEPDMTSISPDQMSIINEIFFQAINDFTNEKIMSQEFDPEIAESALQEIKSILTQGEQSKFLAAANKKTNTLKK